MFKLDRVEIQRVAVAAIGALMLTVVSVGAAVAPSEIGTTPVYAAAAVSGHAHV